MNKKFFAFISLLLFSLVIFPSLISAAEMHTGEQVSLPPERIEDDMYVFGGNVSSSANIIGDLITGGGNVLINGSVSQDLFVGGGSVTIIADVGDDLRVGGGNVNINGSVGGDLISGTGQLQVSGLGVSGDFIWGGGTLQINAPVKGDAKLYGDEVFINAPISGNVTFEGKKLTLGSDAVITGDLSYKSTNEVVILDGASIVGKVSYEPIEKFKGSNKSKAGAGALAAIVSLALLVKFLMVLVTSLVVGLFLKRFSQTLVETALSHPMYEMGRGFLALVAIPVASVILLVTLIGLPLGLLGLIGYVVIIGFSSLIAPIIIGSLLHKWIKKSEGYKVNWKIILLGVLVNGVLGVIPFVGWIIQFAFILITIGVLIKFKMMVIKEWR